MLVCVGFEGSGVETVDVSFLPNLSWVRLNMVTETVAWLRQTSALPDTGLEY